MYIQAVECRVRRKVEDNVIHIDFKFNSLAEKFKLIVFLYSIHEIILRTLQYTNMCFSY